MLHTAKIKKVFALFLAIFTLPLILLAGFYTAVNARPGGYTVTNNENSGAGSLRWAIEQANATPGHDTINFAMSMSGATINLTTGELNVTDSLTIDGSMLPDLVSISGQNSSRVFLLADEFGNSFGVTMTHLIIKNGATVTGSGQCIDLCGGGIYVEYNVDLTLKNSTLENNFANSGGAFLNFGVSRIVESTFVNNSAEYDGGAIRNDGEMTVISSTIESNVSNGVGGGGFMVLFGELTVRHSTIQNNLAFDTNTPSRADGGGIANSYGSSVIVNRSTISNNLALNGGGIFIDSPDFTESALVIEKSTIAYNIAMNNGGGLNAISSSNIKNHIEINNSTLSNNQAGGEGGGINVAGFITGTLRLTVTNATIFQNSSSGTGGIITTENQTSTVTAFIQNSIIAENTGGNCSGITGDNYNLSDDASCTGFTEAPANLGPLTDNGGQTLTHMPNIGSAAINGGDPAVCQAPPVDGVDQRFEPRPTDRCDLGSVEAVNFEMYLPTMQKE